MNTNEEKKQVINTPEDKVRAVKRYLEGEASLRQLAKEYRVHHSAIEKWIHNYQIFGMNGLIRKRTRGRYPESLKMKAVAYVQGEGVTQYEACEKFKLRSISVLQNWIRKYGNKGT